MDFKNGLPVEPRKLCGVYRFTFADGSFYIGCSVNLRKRYTKWSSDFRTKNRLSVSLLHRILVNDSAKMELVELCNKSELKSREAYYLKKHANDPLLLSWAEYAWRPVLQYDLEGLFMKRHPSIGSAAKSNSFKLSKVQMVLSGIRKHHKGMVFAYESGGVLERVTQLEKKVRAVKIEQLTPAGEVIAIHDTYEVAAKNVKCSTKNIRRVLLGEQKTAAGFAWRYAM